MLLRKILLTALPVCLISLGAIAAHSGSPLLCSVSSFFISDAFAQMSCRECSVRRDRCHTGCNSLSTSREQLQCVNRCNASYQCVKGSDCR